jgi:hypothetical protein
MVWCRVGGHLRSAAHAPFDHAPRTASLLVGAAARLTNKHARGVGRCPHVIVHDVHSHAAHQSTGCDFGETHLDGLLIHAGLP